MVGRSELVPTLGQVVQAAIDQTQTPRELRVSHQIGQRRARGMLLSDKDLVQNMLKVVCVDVNHFSIPRNFNFTESHTIRCEPSRPV